MTKFKDVAHLYLGCKMILPEGTIFDLKPLHIPNNWEVVEIFDRAKPILRPLSDMTDDEAYCALFSHPFYGKQTLLNCEFYRGSFRFKVINMAYDSVSFITPKPLMKSDSALIFRPSPNKIANILFVKL